MTSTEVGKKTRKPENPLINIAFNLILPIYLLNNLEKWSSSWPTITEWLGDQVSVAALVVALSFPLGYGIYDGLLRKKVNFMSILGLVNILLTGGLALLHLEGIWFAVKEAVFPLVLGLGALISAFTSKPIMKALFFNENLVKKDLINEKLAESNNHKNFEALLKKSTLFMTASFVLSSILNYVLARRIFIDIDKSLALSKQTSLLNEQIAEMNLWSFVVIALPLTIFTGIIMIHLFKGVKKLTGLGIQDLLKNQ